MKVVGFIGSPRKNGNTDILVRHILKGVAACAIDVESIYLSDYHIAPCTGCEGCHTSFRCVKRDDMQTIYDKLDAADGLVLGSPTYFYNISSITKAFIERLYCYHAFDESDRSVWLSLGELTGIKHAVTVAVCEQNNADDMGLTSVAMDKPLQAVGYRIVESVKVLHMYKKGEVQKHEATLNQAFNAGKKLGKTILLADNLKKRMNNKSPLTSP